MKKWWKPWTWFRKYNKPTQEEERRIITDGAEIGSGHPTDYKVWINGAENIRLSEGIKMNDKGDYRYGFPEGLVVHWTSGWQLLRGHWPTFFPAFSPAAKILKIKKMAREYALRTAKGGAKDGYVFLVMDVLGNVYQSLDMTKHGSHAGKSHWQGVGYSVSKRFTGVEILNPGKLKLKSGKYMTWFGLEIPKENVRHIKTNTANQEAGYYCQYTAEQEVALEKLVNQLCEMSPNINGRKVFKMSNVVGHDEVSPGRKSDPGGSLSISMPEFRKKIIEARDA